MPPYYTSDMIANQIYQANMAMVGPGMAAGPGMTPAMGRQWAGMGGERAAAYMGSMGQMGLAGVRFGADMGMGIAGGYAGTAMAGALGLGTMGTMALSAPIAMAAAVPAMAMGSVFRAYGQAFSGGMQQQASFNSTLRENFDFHGGSGSMGRGFSQSQMGSIGNMIGREMRNNPFTNAQEMNGLIAGGAESGMLTGVRDVQQFSQSFRRMLDTLKSVQRELGGTLTDALSFVRSSQQAGIFQNADRVNFAAEVRTAEAVTGMNRNQLTALAATGANISRAFGGLGRQGAIGALRGAETIGAGLSTGAITMEQLSEVTGLTGDEAVSAFTQNMMTRAGRFSRTGMGRYSLYALSNSEGNGLDGDMLRRFQTGEISVGDVRRRAHQNVAGMGRARAINSEGRLRGEMMEEGGLSAQIGMMRLMLGDRVMDRGDDFASLVMQRRFHMSRDEAGMMTSLMRNQGSIAEREAVDRRSARNEADRNRDFSENRSVDAFLTRLEHGISDASGMTETRDLGRRLVTRVSSAVERAMDRILGTGSDNLSTGDRTALNRLRTGTATSSDISLLGRPSVTSGRGDLFSAGVMGDALHALGMHGPSSVGHILENRGVSGLRGPNGERRAMDAINEANLARAGIVSGSSATALRGMNENSASTLERIALARALAESEGDASLTYRYAGMDAGATDAFLAQGGYAGIGGGAPSRGSMLNAMRGMSLRDMGRAAGGLAAGTLAGGALGGPMGAAGALLAGLEGIGSPGRSEIADIAAGGDLARNTEWANAPSSSARAAGVLGGLGRVAGGGISGLVSGTAGVIGAMTRGGPRGRDAERARALNAITRGSGTSVEDMEGFLRSDGFRQSLSRIEGFGNDRTAIEGELNAMRAAAMASDVSDSDRATRLNAITQMTEEVRGTGGLGARWRNASRDDTRDAALMSEFNSSAADFRGLEGVLTGNMRYHARRASRAFGEMNGEEANTEVRAMTDMLADMDPNSEEYREMSRAMGERSGGSELLTRASNVRRVERDLSGRGRRGRRGAGETILNMITGGRAGELELTGSGGRRVTANTFMGALSGRGGPNEDLLGSLEENMSRMGVRNASDLVGDLRERVASGGWGEDDVRGFRERIEGEMNSTERGSLGDVSRRANEAAMRAANPLDSTRNDLLTEIRNGIVQLNGGRDASQAREN